MKKYIRLYRSSGSDPPVVVHDHIAEHYGLHDGDTVPHDLLPAILDDCRKLNEMFYEVETAKKRGAAMEKKKHSDCLTVDDFIEYYEGASLSELKANKRRLSKGFRDRRSKNELKAIEALLA